MTKIPSPSHINDNLRLKELFENAPIGIFRSLPDGRFLDVNNELAKVLGYDSPAELLSCVRDLATEVYFEPEKRPGLIQRLKSEPGWIQEKMGFKRKDGSVILAEMTARKVLNSSGKIEYFEGFAQDITDRKRSEETLRRSENQFRAFFEKGSDGVVILDPKTGHIVKFNDQACRQLGYTREEFARMTVADFDMNESPETNLTHIQKVIEEGVDTYETKHLTKQGEILNIKVTAQIIQIENESLFYCLYRDITEYKLTETTLALNQARLLEAQSVSNTGSWDLDLITKEMWGSEEAHVIYGLDPEPGLRLPLLVAQALVEPEFRPMMDKALSDLISSKGQIPYDVDFYIRRKNDNSRRAIHSRARVVIDPGGRPIRVAGTIQDITDRKQIEVNIRRLNNELEERVKERTFQLELALKELEAFSYSVSHDLRTPLRSIHGYSSILLSDNQNNLDKESVKYLHLIQQAALRMDELINDLHKLARISQSEIEFKPVNLSQLAREVSEELTDESPSILQAIQIENDMLVNGDHNLLKIALENLLGNTLKFTSRNAGEIKIIIGKQIEGDQKIFYIRDNGVGFDMAHAGKLFKPFQRLHDTADFPGTGIGLSIVERIIHRHNGRIWAESEPGHGATFFFTLG